MTEEPGEPPPDLEPLTLRQKVANKLFNKRLDNTVMPFKTLGLGILGYGAVKPTMDAASGAAFPLGAFAFSLVVGVALLAGATYVQNTMMERED